MNYLRVPIQGDAVVIALDMCSSSDIIEELTLASDLKRFQDFLTSLKEYLASAQRSVLFDPYKFTGDGWILLFFRPTPMGKYWSSFSKICAFSSRESFGSKCDGTSLPHRLLLGLLLDSKGAVGSDEDIWPTRVHRAGPECRL
jgi:hypothetical protein